MAKITLDNIFRNFATTNDSIDVCDFNSNFFRCYLSTLNTSRNDFKEPYFIKIPIIEENIFTRVPLFLLPYYYHSFKYKSECIYAFETTVSSIKNSFFSVLENFLPKCWINKDAFNRYTIKDITVFINKGIILNENLKPLVLLLPKVCLKPNTKSFILKQDDWEVLLDCSLFTDKNSLSTFVKNNLLPILIKYKYVIKIMNLQSKEIFQKPVIPNQTLDIKDSLYETLKKYYNNGNLLII